MRCPAGWAIVCIRGTVILASNQQTLQEQRYTWTHADEAEAPYAISQVDDGFNNITKFLNSSRGSGKQPNVAIEWICDGLLGIVRALVDIDDITELLVDYEVL